MSDEIDFIKTLEAGRPFKKLPWIGMIYGDGKCSKTGIATYAPKPFFIALDPGVGWVFNHPVISQRCQTFMKGDNDLLVAQNVNQTFDMMRWVRSKGQSLDIKTVILDGVKFFEEWTFEQAVIDNPICGSGDKVRQTKTFDDLGMDRYDLTKPYWSKLMTGCKSLKEKGFNVLLISHSALKTRQNDRGDSYKETVIDLPQWGSLNVPNMFHRECDFVYYVDAQVTTATSGAGKWAKQVARSDSELMTRIHTRPTSLFYAGCRSANEDKIPDFYSYDKQSRDETIMQMFADLE